MIFCNVSDALLNILAFQTMKVRRQWKTQSRKGAQCIQMFGNKILLERKTIVLLYFSSRWQKY